MFDSPLFDTAIALVTLYLLFSQLTLSLVELPAGVLNTRGKYLYDRLKEALGPDIQTKFYASSTIQSISLPKKDKSWLLRNRVSLWPAYISETLFAQTIIACVIGPVPAPGVTPIAQFNAGLTNLLAPTPADNIFKGTLETLYANAISVGSGPEEQSAALLRNLESWFHDFGERLTGRYKRDNRKYLFWAGLLVALMADVDSVRLARFLADSTNAKVRAALVAFGVQATQGARPTDSDYDLNNPVQAAEYEKREREWSAALKLADAELKATLAAVPQVGLPLGYLRWNNREVMPVDTTTHIDSTSGRPQRVYNNSLPVTWAPTADDYKMPAYAQRHILNATTGQVTDAPGWHWSHMMGGWLLTAFVLMLGAPFWFDTLCRFVNIRNVGIKPAPANKNRS
jgi:hypothetical protein